MKNGVLTSLFISVGTGLGFYFGWSLAKKKYEHLADKEVESVKKSLVDHYEKIISDPKLLSDMKAKNNNKQSKKKKDLRFSTIVSKEESENYFDYSAAYRSENVPDRIPGIPRSPEVKKSRKKETVNESKKPYVISPEEFSESNYETKTLFYYADKVLADEDNNILLDIENHIGVDSLTQFGVYEDSAVYVRNDTLGIDYEILLDERLYSKVSPRPAPGSVNDINTDDD